MDGRRTRGPVVSVGSGLVAVALLSAPAALLLPSLPAWAARRGSPGWAATLHRWGLMAPVALVGLALLGFWLDLLQADRSSVRVAGLLPADAGLGLRLLAVGHGEIGLALLVLVIGGGVAAWMHARSVRDALPVAPAMARWFAVLWPVTGLLLLPSDPLPRTSEAVAAGLGSTWLGDGWSAWVPLLLAIGAGLVWAIWFVALSVAARSWPEAGRGEIELGARLPLSPVLQLASAIFGLAAAAAVLAPDHDVVPEGSGLAAPLVVMLLLAALACTWAARGVGRSRQLDARLALPMAAVGLALVLLVDDGPWSQADSWAGSLLDGDSGPRLAKRLAWVALALGAPLIGAWQGVIAVAHPASDGRWRGLATATTLLVAALVAPTIALLAAVPGTGSNGAVVVRAVQFTLPLLAFGAVLAAMLPAFGADDRPRPELWSLRLGCWLALPAVLAWDARAVVLLPGWIVGLAVSGWAPLLFERSLRLPRRHRQRLALEGLAPVLVSATLTTILPWSTLPATSLAAAATMLLLSLTPPWLALLTAAPEHARRPGLAWLALLIPFVALAAAHGSLLATLLVAFFVVALLVQQHPWPGRPGLPLRWAAVLAVLLAAGLTMDGEDGLADGLLILAVLLAATVLVLEWPQRSGLRAPGRAQVGARLAVAAVLIALALTPMVQLGASRGEASLANGEQLQLAGGGELALTCVGPQQATDVHLIGPDGTPQQRFMSPAVELCLELDGRSASLEWPVAGTNASLHPTEVTRGPWTVTVTGPLVADPAVVADHASGASDVPVAWSRQGPIGAAVGLLVAFAGLLAVAGIAPSWTTSGRDEEAS